MPDVITATNTKEFAEILRGEDCGGSIGRFAKTYAGKTIQFDGSVVDVAPHGSYKTRFDYLLGPGNKGPSTNGWPICSKFEDVNYYDFNLTGKHMPDSIDVGGKFRFSAEVDRYVANTCLFFLSPRSRPRPADAIIRAWLACRSLNLTPSSRTAERRGTDARQKLAASRRRFDTHMGTRFAAE